MWNEEQMKLYIRRDVKFLEDEFDVREKPKTRDTRMKGIGAELPGMLDQEEQAPKKQHSVPEADTDANENCQEGQRARCNTQPPKRYGEWAAEEDMEDLDCIRNFRLEVLFNMMNEGQPKSAEEAVNNPEANYWKAAIKEELDSLAQMETWTLVPPTKDDTKYRWLQLIFKRKYDENGQIDGYKARLVARGFSQNLIWNGLSRDLRSSGTTQHSENSDCCGSVYKCAGLPDGCEDGFPEWNSARNRVYEAIARNKNRRERKLGMQAQQVSLWAEAISTPVEHLTKI